MKEQRLGIDFGTSNTSASTLRENGRAFLFPLQRHLNTQPSGVFIRQDGYNSVGFDAIDDYINTDPKESLSCHHVVISNISKFADNLVFNGV